MHDDPFGACYYVLKKLTGKGFNYSDGHKAGDTDVFVGGVGVYELGSARGSVIGLISPSRSQDA